MNEAIQIRMGGYGPPTTTHSRALKFIGDALEHELGDKVEVKYIWNIMDFGYRSEDILWLVERGIVSLGYQSTSYLTDRVFELGFVDLPFLFADIARARAAFDGALGQYLTGKIENECNYRILGYFENGFRHITNKVRPVRTPADLDGIRIRVLPSAVHARTFELLGAVPVRCDLVEAIAWIKDGSLDAQENPFANTVTYGVHKHHRYHTLSSHFYLSRAVFANRDQFESWPGEVRAVLENAMAGAVARQRELAVAEEAIARKAIEDEGCEIVELSAQQHDAFAAAVKPLYAQADSLFGRKMFDLI